MIHTARTALAAALIAGFGIAAVAQTSAQAPVAPGAAATQQQQPRMHGEGHHQFDPAKMQERMAKRQAALKAKLQITPAQEGAWTTWTGTMKPPANMQRPDRAELAKLSTPERIDRMRSLRAARMAEMDKRGEATKAFYAALTPEQKKTFDAETARMHGGRGHHARHHG